MALAEYELPRRFSPGLVSNRDFGFSQKLFRPDTYPKTRLRLDVVTDKGSSGRWASRPEQFSAKANLSGMPAFPGLKRRGNSCLAKAKTLFARKLIRRVR